MHATSSCSASPTSRTCGSHTLTSSVQLLTLLMCTPSCLCTPEHSMQIRIPRLSEAQSGSGDPQSAQRRLPATRLSRSNGGTTAGAGAPAGRRSKRRKGWALVQVSVEGGWDQDCQRNLLKGFFSKATTSQGGCCTTYSYNMSHILLTSDALLHCGTPLWQAILLLLLPLRRERRR